ncbi:membrane protein of unknown function [Candidatus Promineifilum breve]|uniref:Uncharacterized protein n=2 Tax=Candidatus Promineifilum breve TaxID=1806508 RepID=A0A160T7R3_9CHLR|nr:membrane protein of unknown function [Candidatus Promineifilum breve]
MIAMSLPPGTIRPVAARVVLGGVWLLALWNAARAMALAQQTDWLTGLPFAVDSRWRLALAGGWAALLALSAIGLWRQWPAARRFVPLLLLCYGVYELGMIIAFSPTPPALLPVLLYAGFVGFAGWALWRPIADKSFPLTHRLKEVAESRTHESQD